MAIHVIVDGYNAIRRTPQLAARERLGLDAGRRALLDRIAAYRRASGHRLTVVFDGTDTGNAGARRGRDRGVEVIFTAHGTTADDEILHLAGDPSRGAVVVVTADAGLGRAVRRRGAVVVSPEAFDARLARAAAGEAGPPAAPRAGADAEPWPGGKDEAEDEEGARRGKRGNPRKAPRAARRAVLRLRKL